MTPQPEATAGVKRRHQVVIIGSGFGGLNAAKKLKRADVDIKLIARTTHHLFQPLLYQVATGIISEGEIAVALTPHDLQQLQDSLAALESNLKSFPRQENMEPMHSEDLMENIRRRAHELYEERGREPGYAEQDWFRAEAEVLARHRAEEHAAAA